MTELSRDKWSIFPSTDRINYYSFPGHRLSGKNNISISKWLEKKENIKMIADGKSRQVPVRKVICLRSCSPEEAQMSPQSRGQEFSRLSSFLATEQDNAPAMRKFISLIMWQVPNIFISLRHPIPSIAEPRSLLSWLTLLALKRQLVWCSLQETRVKESVHYSQWPDETVYRTKVLNTGCWRGDSRACIEKLGKSIYF